MGTNLSRIRLSEWLGLVAILLCISCSSQQKKISEASLEGSTESAQNSLDSGESEEVAAILEQAEASQQGDKPAEFLAKGEQDAGADVTVVTSNEMREFGLTDESTQDVAEGSGVELESEKSSVVNEVSNEKTEIARNAVVEPSTLSASVDETFPVTEVTPPAEEQTLAAKPAVLAEPRLKATVLAEPSSRAAEAARLATEQAMDSEAERELLGSAAIVAMQDNQTNQAPKADTLDSPAGVQASAGLVGPDPAVPAPVVGGTLPGKMPSSPQAEETRAELASLEVARFIDRNIVSILAGGGLLVLIVYWLAARTRRSKRPDEIF
ncbi:MAG: hypothetical protein HY537_16300 [Deltaproteobacteria bacterium]|nr:hypothetical protein [Deltaproteobacteria bacterium]